MRNRNKKNSQFLDSAYLNDATYIDYMNRMKKIATSMFEWVNLPESMDARHLENTLFEDGQAALLLDSTYGFINTHCADNGQINIYDLPTAFNCYSNQYHTIRKLYTGIVDDKDFATDKQCILVMNTFDRTPTLSTLHLFAYRLYLAQRSCDTNIMAMRTPVMLLGSEKQKLTMENLYSQFDGNRPFIFGDNDIISADMLKAIKTDAPYVADKITDYKKEIWNEMLSFLGINNIDVEKKKD